MQLVTALYENNNKMSTAFGLTKEECCVIMDDTMKAADLSWDQEEDDEPEKADDRGQAEETKRPFVAATVYTHLLQWGWIRSEYDERLNTDVISFPEYSQLFAEVFKKLQKDDDSQERESMLSVYSALFTYARDTEQNNDILRSALQTSRSLSQLLSNMQDSMRAYFDELSAQKNFIGVQQVLVEELNNSDSRKYAILTTTDSFYRYKEAVKELVSQILHTSELKKEELQNQLEDTEPDTLEAKRTRRSMERCEEAIQLVYLVEREFDQIERKYNVLIEQKTVFARRALARIHYILQEGTRDGDDLVTLINLLDRSEKREDILSELRQKIRMSTSYKNLTESSLSARRDRQAAQFAPVAMDESERVENDLTDFVPRPLYTGKELRQFREKNTMDGVFVTTTDTVQSVEDLEKLMFLWQEETKEHQDEDTVYIEGEIQDDRGFTYSSLRIPEKGKQKR